MAAVAQGKVERPASDDESPGLRSARAFGDSLDEFSRHCDRIMALLDQAAHDASRTYDS